VPDILILKNQCYDMTSATETKVESRGGKGVNKSIFIFILFAFVGGIFPMTRFLYLFPFEIPLWLYAAIPFLVSTILFFVYSRKVFYSILCGIMGFVLSIVSYLIIVVWVMLRL
jgi:hypothetical protein